MERVSFRKYCWTWCDAISSICCTSSEWNGQTRICWLLQQWSVLESCHFCFGGYFPRKRIQFLLNYRLWNKSWVICKAVEGFQFHSILVQELHVSPVLQFIHLGHLFLPCFISNVLFQIAHYCSAESKGWPSLTRQWWYEDLKNLDVSQKSPLDKKLFTRLFFLQLFRY